MMLQNPLEPRQPDAPPWDPNATAKGVYFTDSMERAMDYANLIGEEDESTGLIIGIDPMGLKVHPDPQVIDLLQEPYDTYRSQVLDWLSDEYREARQRLKDKGLERAEIRLSLGTFYQFAKDFILNHLNAFRPAQPNYPKAGTYYKQKVEAAIAILPEPSSWYPLRLFKEIFGPDCWLQIWQWLAWTEVDDESEYSPQRYFCSSRNSTIPPEVLIKASGMFYFSEAISEDRLTRIWSFDPEIDSIKLLWTKRSSNQEVYHGTSLKRTTQAFPELNI